VAGTITPSFSLCDGVHGFFFCFVVANASRRARGNEKSAPVPDFNVPDFKRIR
jgi:hypothetical protein